MHWLSTENRSFVFEELNPAHKLYVVYWPIHRSRAVRAEQKKNIEMLQNNMRTRVRRLMTDNRHDESALDNGFCEGPRTSAVRTRRAKRRTK